MFVCDECADSASGDIRKNESWSIAPIPEPPALEAEADLRSVAFAAGLQHIAEVEEEAARAIAGPEELWTFDEDAARHLLTALQLRQIAREVVRHHAERRPHANPSRTEDPR